MFARHSESGLCMAGRAFLWYKNCCIDHLPSAWPWANHIAGIWGSNETCPCPCLIKSQWQLQRPPHPQLWNLIRLEAVEETGASGYVCAVTCRHSRPPLLFISTSDDRQGQQSSSGSRQFRSRLVFTHLCFHSYFHRWEQRTSVDAALTHLHLIQARM